MSEAPAREAEAPGGGGETLVPAALRHGSIAALPTARRPGDPHLCVPAAAPALPRPLTGVGVRACCHDRPPPRRGGVDPWATAT